MTNNKFQPPRGFLPGIPRDKKNRQMKKLIILGAALLALGFVSCDEENTLGIPQENPQGPVLEGNGIEVKPGAILAGDAIDLNDYVEKGSIPVIELVSQDAAYDGSAYLTMELASKEDFSNMTELAVTDGAVSTEEWNKYFRKVLGASPAPKTMYVRFAAYANVNNQKIRIGGVDNYYAAKTLTVTPLPAEFEVEQTYYLTGVINGWKLDDTNKMTHTEYDVFVDPVFTALVSVTDEQAAAGWMWKAVPQSALEAAGDEGWNVVLGAEGGDSEEMSGKLVAASNSGAIVIKEAGTYLLSINLKTMSYYMAKVITTPGASNGWKQTESSLLVYDDRAKVYRGFAHLSDAYKLSTGLNWDGTNYGDGGDGKLNTAGDAGNLTVPADGMYWVVADLEEMTCQTTAVSSIGAIGAMNGWASQLPTTPSPDYMSWTGDVTFTAATDVWKFRANDDPDWTINLGGEQYNMTLDGSDMDAPGAGTYEIILYLGVPYRYLSSAK